jgi:tetratricopeptide (TPR) repeat protein
VQDATRTLGPDHIYTLVSVRDLAGCLGALGRHAEELRLHRRNLQACERVLGAEHPETLAYVNRLCGCLAALGRVAEARPLYARNLGARERALGREHPDTLVSVKNLAGCLGALGRHADALPLHERALEVYERTLGAEHPHTLSAATVTASCLGALGRAAEALPLHRRAAEAAVRALGPDHADALAYGRKLAGCIDAAVSNVGKVLKALPAPGKVLDAAEADALVATLGGVATDLAALPRGEAAGRLCQPVLRHLWPLLKARLLDPARRRQALARHGLYLLTFLLGALLEPPHRWYCRCSCALDAAQVLLAARADAGALPDAGARQRASDALELASRLACKEDLDGGLARIQCIQCIRCIQCMHASNACARTRTQAPNLRMQGPPTRRRPPPRSPRRRRCGACCSRARSWPGPPRRKPCGPCCRCRRLRTTRGR